MDDDGATAKGGEMRRRWRMYQPWHLEHLPQQHGCYVIYVGGLVQYVGQSENLRARLKSHLTHVKGSYLTETPWGTLPNVIVKIRRDLRYGERLMREARLIRKIQPPMNARIGGPLFLATRYRWPKPRRLPRPLLPTELEDLNSMR